MHAHLVDGTYELFRAHHSPAPSRRDPGGRDVKATVGLVASLLRLLDEEDVTHVAVAFDNPIESFRNDLLDTYKDSSDVDQALLAQFDAAEEAVRSLGIRTWSMDTHEADDALATAARALADEVAQVRVMTPDKDLAQAVRSEVVVQVDRMRGRTWDAAGVRERLGVDPVSVPDYLALVGDRADGIPGLPGIGATTASRLLSRYGHLEDIPPDHTDWEVSLRGAARAAATLAAHREDAARYRRVATLVTDLPLRTDPEALAWQGVPRSAYLAWCDRLGVRELRTRPHRWAS